MSSVLAIVSKALFEKMVPKDVKLGAVVDIDRYTSSNKAFEGVAKGGAIFLVTVRPPSEKLWLVGILENPKKKGADWISASNSTPLADITAAIKKFEFESGTGLKPKKGALGMSLQTPRVLTEGDVAVIRGLVPKASGATKVTASAAYREAVAETVAKGKAKPAAKGKPAKGTKPAKGKADAGGLRLENARLPFTGKLADLEEFEKQQLAQIVDGGNVEAMFGGEVDEEWAEARIVDIVDGATGTVKYQMHLFGYGDGLVFTNETTKVAAGICQHGFDQELSKPEMRDLAKAWARDAKRLKLWENHIDFRSDEGEGDGDGE